MVQAIEIKNVTKVYKLYNKPLDRLKESFGKRALHKEFIALNNITFNVNRGEIVGILGTNGSGKSTILKIITGILQATTGEVIVNGKISALLELGAGFNYEATGMENIYLNGAISGLSKEEIDSRLEDIISFSEIGEFVYQPVKTYSSGMFARLAFAVSINIDPDILIIDEALAVGDMYFQEKCYEKMKQMVSKGVTILFVSHSIPAIRNFCTRAVWIEKGELKAVGKADEICELYKQHVENQEVSIKTHVPLKQNESNRLEVNEALKQKNKIYVSDITLDKFEYITGEDIHITLSIEFKEIDLKYGLGLIVFNSEGDIVTLFNTLRDDISLNEPYNEFTLILPENDFLQGNYYISVHISDDLGMYPYDSNDYAIEFSIKTNKSKNGLPISEGMFRSKHIWKYK
ncbi:ATP-binding cassette domain-containing protein [Paenibacillus sp. LMG 31460]|uniref:ATP-binding cassette domain-containing protein n=1 Tax=Paenibacillus germinis TaxID=2654979 RepID=A0ABX1Z3G5_9BACL|nr:ABC transporter ATP-binding protein [Paenibacillus germinis]NOU87932.1 ATP-binding cassette domain-containing protein [Paenibacillus germinis]